MTEEFEYKGYWWLPEKPEHTVAGVLKYIPNSKIVLELIGSFDVGKCSVEAFLDKKNESVIHGLTSDSKEITLFDCYPSGSINMSCPFPIIRYNCQNIIIGKHLDNITQKSFFKAYIRVPELNFWSPPSSINNFFKFDDKDKIESTILSFRSGERISNNVKINNKTSLLIKDGINYNSDHYKPKLEQYTYLEIVKEEDADINEFFSDIVLFQHFLSLATLKTIENSSIILFDKTVFQELKDGEKLYHPIKFLYIQDKKEESSLIKNSNYLFTYELISAEYPDVIKKWYEDKGDIAPIRTHLIDSVKSNKMFSSIDFLIVIQAIEGFWWRFRDVDYKQNNSISFKKQTDLKTIIEKLLEEFVSIQRINKLDIQIKDVVDSRHYYSHFMNKVDKPNTLDGFDLYKLTKKLRVLLICCILNFVGFENDRINEILNKCSNRLLF